MTSPSAVGGAGTGLGIAGTILSAFGSYQSGKAQAKQYDYLAGVAKARAQVDLQNRDYALAAGETEAENYGLRARQISGKIMAGQGASGIDVGSGSSTQVRQGQEMVAHRDLAQIRNNAARTAYGFEVESAFDTAQAGAYTSAAAGVRKAMPLNIAASLISGAGSVASKWYQGQATGLTGGSSSAESDVYDMGPDTFVYETA